MKEMVGGCCVCSDDRGWAENPLVYCDGNGCTVAVHQACYGIVTVPQGNWYCRKCELITDDKTTKVRCELCPNKDGALKLTDNKGWAHVVCALYIPEVRFGNVTTMEPIILEQIPQDRYNKACYICEDKNRGSSRSTAGACMNCNKAGCKQQFHVTCAQLEGLLCEEAGNWVDNVKYCGYCHHHYSKLSLSAKQRKGGGHVKTIPAYRPVGSESETSNSKETEPTKATSKRKNSTGSTKGNKTNQNNDEQNQDEVLSKEPLNPPQEKTSNTKRKKGGSRTPPAVSPELSPRPPTPQLTPPVSTPPVATSTLPGQVSAAAIVASAPTTSLTTVAEKRPQPATVLKETRPNSIVVNLPLEALPTPSVPTIPSPIMEPVSPPTAQSPIEISPTSQQPIKRIRSQSSDKDKARRGGKRNSGYSSSSSVVLPTSKPLLSPNNIPKTESSHPMMPQSSHNHFTPVPPILEKPKKFGGLNISTTTNHAPPVVKEEKDVKLVAPSHMLGNQLNPASSMAQKMCDTLSQEANAHSIFGGGVEHFTPSQGLVGPHRTTPSSSTSGVTLNQNAAANSIWTNSIPQTLEQLLERQWEQGSQFLMEQAQHFDIASLLSCLHQLRAENAQLEDHVATLSARRDQLLAVNARLAIPFTTSVLNTTTNTTTNTNSQILQPVENGISIQSHNQEFRSISRGQGNGQSSITINSQYQCTPNSVLVRTSSETRRSSQSPGVFNSNTLPHQSSQIIRRGDVHAELQPNNRAPNS